MVGGLSAAQEIRRKEAQRIIEALANRWRAQFAIEEILGHMAEVRSYQRIGEYFERGLIDEATARRCIRLLDEAL